MPRATPRDITQRTSASEFLIAVNRIRLSQIVRDPFVATAFRAAEDEGLAPDFVEQDHPRHLDGGAAEKHLELAEA